jgi:hypothetical protein
MKRNLLGLLAMVIAVTGCHNRMETKLPDTAELLHQNQFNLTDLIVYDIFSPPVASRIYVYTSLAMHEAIRHLDPNEPSIVLKLNGFPVMPGPENGKKYNYALAATKAFYAVAAAVTFSKDSLVKYESAAYAPFKESLDKNEYDNSVNFGNAIAAKILERMADDNYLKTRALEKYYGSKGGDRWQPTAPDYLDGVEPYWNQIKTLIMDSASQFNPAPPPAFSPDKNSVFFKMNMEVYDVGKNLTPAQKEIAKFWDDNPFVMEHSGHLMAASKKQTPGGHWMGIATIACRQTGAGAVKSARTYALTALALFEAFISVFDTKYRYSYVRPITFINEGIDPKWEPFLQTPAFPEYTSGHSTITGSAATVLTRLYGDDFEFQDTSDMRFINMQRYFKSFIQASDECSISRLYGGIHYRISVDIGAETGKKIGAFILKKLNIKEDTTP